MTNVKLTDLVRDTRPFSDYSTYGDFIKNLLVIFMPYHNAQCLNSVLLITHSLTQTAISSHHICFYWNIYSKNGKSSRMNPPKVHFRNLQLNT